MNARLFLLSAGLLLAGSVITAHLATAQNAAPPAADAQTIAHGKYLAAAGDCVACHTAPGGAPFAGGTVINTPFGKLLGPNLTPDQATGIGGWTDDQFVQAVKYGYGHNVGHLYPGLPYIYFNKVPTADLLKIRAYLNSIPPVHNQIVSNQLPFPFDIRTLMIGWNLLYFPNKGDYQPDPSQSAEWNRGAYLVQGLGHCAACHTPKNSFGGDKTGQEFTGYIVDGANAPALVNSTADGLGIWSVDDIATYLKNGRNRYAAASGPMASVITHSTSQLTTADDHAIATYLKSLPGNATPPAPVAASDPAMLAGGHVFADECAACHTSAGTGEPDLIPSLQASPVVNAADPATLMHVVLNGGRGVATAAAPTASAMPAFRGILDDQQVADVLTYVRNSWGNAAPAVTADQVSDPPQ
jgi:mono/diheme cytochrome c family protein